MATQPASAPAIVSLNAALEAIAGQHHLTTEGVSCISKRRAAALYRFHVADPVRFVQSCATHGFAPTQAPTQVVVKVFRAVGEREGAAEVQAAGYIERMRATTDCTMVARYFFAAHKSSFASPSAPASSLTYVIMEWSVEHRAVSTDRAGSAADPGAIATCSNVSRLASSVPTSSPPPLPR